MSQIDPLREYLSLTYNELFEKNTEMRVLRENGKDDNYFRDKIQSYLREERKIKAVTVCFTDIEGKMLMLDYNPGFLLDAWENLTFDGSSIKGFTSQNMSDLRLKIDWSTFKWLPSDIFGPGKVLVFANVCNQDGSYYSADYRSQLASFAQDIFKKDKITAFAAPETEGILLEGVDAEQNFDENNGFGLVTKGGYFNSLPQDTLRIFIDRVAEALGALGFQNEKDHPEVAPSQFELNFKYTDILHAADRIQVYKLICRQVAKTLGCTASFLPKPKMNINGSGMHTNISLSVNGKNIFYDSSKENNVSDESRKFLTAILYHAKDLCLLLNSSVNSYRRLDPAYEAPNEIKFSGSDRSSMIRIPLGNEKSARIEVRSVAPDGNPYLIMYSLLKTGMHGIKASDDELLEYETIHERREKLPANIYDALRYFKKSEWAKNVLGAENQKKYISLKESGANRCAKDLGGLVKNGEVMFHHEVTNQYLWGKF